jgi:SecD/SecF fusion protein
MPAFILLALIAVLGCTGFALGIQVDLPGDGTLDSLGRLVIGLGAVAATNLALWWACRRLAMSPTRMLVTANVFLVCIFLLFLQNKAMVGTQELQAEVTAGEKPDTYIVAFRDLAGVPVDAGATERQQLITRISSESNGDPIKLVSGPDATSDHKLALTLEPGQDQAFRDRVVNKPFNRPNDPRGLFEVNRGIDLRGGVEFICQLHDDLGKHIAADEDVVAILRNRLDSRGLTEPTVTRLGNGDVQIVIPGGTPADAARTRKVIEQTGRLEFREVLHIYTPTQVGGHYTLPDEVVAHPDGSYGLNRKSRKEIIAVPKNRDPTSLPTMFYHLGPAELTGKDVKDAARVIESGRDAVSITFTSSGAARNYEFTHRLWDDRQKHPTQRGSSEPHGMLAILFDGKVESAPMVDTPSNASCLITGSFTPEEIDSLKSALKGGSLSVTPVVLSERVVGATLGNETVNRAVSSMLWSCVGILGFMALYYRRLGVVAMFCLLVGGALTWSALSILGATMTLPGFAGLVLSIAMSVDTNILVYERMREELREGKDLKTAIAEGYGRAWSAILDFHLTAIFSGMILYWLGTGSVKGFGLTLSVGVAVSMFGGVYVGHLLTDLLCRNTDRISMSSWIPELKLPYVRWRRFSYTLSFLTGVAGLIYFAFGHTFHGHGTFNRNFEIDFTGGNLTQVIFKEELSAGEVKDALAKAWKSDPKRFALLSPEELAAPQAYFATLGGGEKSRQWVFRGRDEEGAVLEDQRAKLDLERGEISRKLEKARDPDKADPGLVRELEPKLREKGEEIAKLEAQIAGRVAVFKDQLAGAFPGRVAAEGSEVLEAEWKDQVLTMRLAALATPTGDQLAHVKQVLAHREELSSVEVAPLAGSPGLEIRATYRRAPSAVEVEAVDAEVARFRELLAPSAGDQAKNVAHAANDLFQGALQATGSSGITIAQPYPASQHFSGQVANSMKFNALLALTLASAVMLAYIAARFELGFGIAAIAAMLHDLMLTLGLISFFGLRIDLTVVAAFLTLIGYSVNDTIVTFDRIRENLKKHGNMPLAQIIDEAIAQTMPRTVLTAGITIAALAFMAVFAGPDIFAFNMTLLIGVVLGTYSSIFVAAPLLLLFDRSKLQTPEPAAEAVPGGDAAAETEIAAG